MLLFRQPKSHPLLLSVNTLFLPIFCSSLLPILMQLSFLILYKSVKPINISQRVKMVISLLLPATHFLLQFPLHYASPTTGLLITTQRVISRTNYWHSFLMAQHTPFCRQVLLLLLLIIILKPHF